MIIRYFYLLCFVIYIKETVSYDDKYYNSLKRTRSHKHLGKRLIKPRDRNTEKFYKTNHNIKRRQGFGPLNENDFTQIDVASFIQKPDLYADDDSPVLKQNDFKSQPISKHFSEYDDINKIIRNLDNDESLNTKEHLQSNHDTDLNSLSKSYLEDPSKSRKDNEFWNEEYKNIFGNKRDVNHFVHNPPKKRCNTNYTWKFPFFFHKSKHRPSLNIIKKQRKADFDHNIDVDSDGDYTQNGMKNRASKGTNPRQKIERLVTKNSSIGDNEKSPRKCHNSRQYFQNLLSTNQEDNVTEAHKLTLESSKDIEANKQEPNTQTCLPSDSTSYLSKDCRKKLRKRKENLYEKKKSRKKNTTRENNYFS